MYNCILCTECKQNDLWMNDLYEWMSFAISLCYFFSKGNYRPVSSLFKIPQPDHYLRKDIYTKRLVHL
jgi:hypothetical protein